MFFGVKGQCCSEGLGFFCYDNRMKEYKYILLDWDGNLAKTLDVWLVAIRTFLLNNDIRLPDIEILNIH